MPIFLALDVLTKLYAKDLQLGISIIQVNMCNSFAQRSRRMKLKGFKNLMRSGLFCKKRRNSNGSRFVHLIVTVKKIISAELTPMKMMTAV